MELRLVYVTAGSEDEAADLAQMLVAERLAACVNILGEIRSFYRWKDEVCDDRETAFLAKTTADKLDRLVERVKEQHSYECPCVVAMPIADGHADFLKWIAAETGAG